MLFAIIASAHNGKTDSSGGHYDHSTGQYHYHHGYPAHQHYDMNKDGIIDCPYDFVDNTDHSNSGNSNSENSTTVDGTTVDSNTPTSKPRVTSETIFKIIGASLVVIILLSAFLFPLSVLVFRKLVSVLSKKLFDVEPKESTSNTISIIIIIVLIVTIVSIIVLNVENII